MDIRTALSAPGSSGAEVTSTCRHNQGNARNNRSRFGYYFGNFINLSSCTDFILKVENTSEGKEKIEHYTLMRLDKDTVTLNLHRQSFMGNKIIH